MDRMIIITTRNIYIYKMANGKRRSAEKEVGVIKGDEVQNSIRVQPCSKSSPALSPSPTGVRHGQKLRQSVSKGESFESSQCNLSCFGTDHESTIIVGFVGKIKRVEELICPHVLRFPRGGVDMQLTKTSKCHGNSIHCQNTRWRGIKVLERLCCQIYFSALLQHSPNNRLSVKWLDESLSVFKQQHFDVLRKQYLAFKMITNRVYAFFQNYGL